MSRFVGALAGGLVMVVLVVVVAVVRQTSDESPGRQTLHWVALGDSYSAGEGVPPFEPADGCDRSTEAWPRQANDQLNSRLGYRANVDLVACSGATIDSVREGDSGSGPQLAALDGRPDAATITVGGNDLDFAGVVASCFLPGSCDLEAAKGSLPALENRLTTLYRNIQQDLPDPQRLVVVGYPRVTAASADFDSGSFQCRLLGGPNSETLRDGADLFNEAISGAAGAVGATYVDVSESLAHHEVCAGPESNWWIPGIAINGAASGLGDLLSPASFHPTQAGLAAQAALVAPVIDRVVGGGRS